MKQLQQLIKSSNRLLVVGVGNVLKGDDGVGVYISRNIETISTIMPLNVELSIENYIGKINQLEPDAVIIVDAVDFNEEPGYTKLIAINELKNHTSHTHNISLNQLEAFFQMPIYVMGIQPEKLDFDESLSPSVKAAADKVLALINSSQYARTTIGQ